MITVKVEPGTREDSNATQDALEQLYLEMKLAAPEAEIAPEMAPAIAENREPITVLTTLIVSGIKLGVFAGIFKVWTTWLENRPHAEITIQGKNGATLKINSADPEQAMRFFHDQEDKA
jgi:hypothetical protein